MQAVRQWHCKQRANGDGSGTETPERPYKGKAKIFRFNLSISIKQENRALRKERMTKLERIKESVGTLTLEREGKNWRIIWLWKEDPCREGQIDALDREQQEAAQFTNRTVDCDWETLAQRRTTARLWALFTACCGERDWKGIGTGCEGLTVWVRLVMLGKLGTGSRERISGSIAV
jgi:hypothetical protein